MASQTGSKKEAKSAAVESETVGTQTATTRPALPPERHQFRALILANPNYFGNLAVSPFPPVLKIVGDTTYEEIGCVGFQPQFNRLDAVVFIKQPFGYGGNVCMDGTPEYVRFYLSLDNGATWQDVGLTSFAAHDIPGASEEAQLEYAVSVQVNPAKKFCFFPNLAMVRAILSWNVPPPPNDPNFTPVWGNVHDTNIQIEPLELIILADLFKELKVHLPAAINEVVDLQQPAPSAAPKALSALELQELYKGKGVEPHRFALAQLNKLIHQPAAGESLMAAGFKGALTGLEINLQEIIAKLFPVNGDTRYEQLECIGFNQNQNVFSGVIRVKLPNGYSGGLCTAGSQEYVTFWADFDGSGNFATCLGTTSVNVHDVQNIPKGGLEYSVFLPVDFSQYQQPCDDGARIVPIRAILSWQVAPPCNDPDYVPVWGNREETRIQIMPGIEVQGQVPFLSAVGDIPEINIDGTGIANGTAIHTGFPAVDSPFGGVITIAGHISNAGPGLKYRVMRKPHGAPDITYVPLTDEPVGLALTINTFNIILGWVQTNTTVHADADGYYPYEDYSSDHSVEGNIMGRWYSTVAEDGLTFDLRIDLSVDGNPAHDAHSNVVTVLVDNTAPVAKLDIDLGGGVECADFAPGATFTGHYTATDIHFKEFSFVIRPAGPAHGHLPAPASGLSNHYGGGMIADPGVAGAVYTLNTTGMDPCGYSLTLQVWDRTNVNSGAGNNYNEASVGFCIQTPQPQS
jgi:hypothetical protein